MLTSSWPSFSPSFESSSESQSESDPVAYLQTTDQRTFCQYRKSNALERMLPPLEESLAELLLVLALEGKVVEERTDPGLLVELDVGVLVERLEVDPRRLLDEVDGVRLPLDRFDGLHVEVRLEVVRVGSGALAGGRGDAEREGERLVGEVRVLGEGLRRLQAE